MRLAGAAGRLGSNSKRVVLKNGWETELRDREDAARVELFGEAGLFRLAKTETSKYYRVLLRLDKLEPGEDTIHITYHGRGRTRGVLEWAALLNEDAQGGRQFVLRERLRSVGSVVDVAGSIDGRLPASYQGPYFVAFQFATDAGEFVLEHLAIEVGGVRVASARGEARGGTGEAPHPLFDSAWYLEQLPIGLEAGESALSHYLRIGDEQGLNPHPLFDAKWYRAQLSQPLRSGETALQHYIRVGAAAGLSPHPLFDPAWYRRSASSGGSTR